MRRSSGAQGAHATAPPGAAAAARNGGAAASTSGGAPDTAAARKQQFLREWGAEYGYGGAIDELYRREIGGRLPSGEHYLDYTGSALYCRTPLQAAFNDLQVRRCRPVARSRCAAPADHLRLNVCRSLERVKRTDRSVARKRRRCALGVARGPAASAAPYAGVHDARRASRSTSSATRTQSTRRAA